MFEVLSERLIYFYIVNTVKSRYNGLQGTRENYSLLSKSVIAKMTMEDHSLKKKQTKRSTISEPQKQ